MTDFLVPRPSWILQYILLSKVEYYFLNGNRKLSFTHDYHILLLLLFFESLQFLNQASISKIV